MPDPKKFVTELEISYPQHRIESITPHNALQSALESGEEEKAAAFINNKSLVSFVASVGGQNRQDVLNSTLLAQLAANKKFPDETDMLNWYKAYTGVLSQIGWSVQAKDFSVVDTSHKLFEMENVVLDIIGSAVGGSAVAIIAKTLEAFRKLSNTDNRIVAFEKNTHSLQKGSFQLALADETDGVVSLTMAGFAVSSQEKITRILFFKSSKAQTELKVSSMTGTLNIDTYSLVRKGILDKLGQSATDIISSIEI